MSTPTTSNDDQKDIKDASQYMRTYAKDMAALSAKQGGAPAPVQKPEPAKPTDTTDGVSLPQVDESLITQDRIRKTGDEPVDIGDEATGESVDVFEQQKQEPPAPVQKPTPRPAPQVSSMSMAPGANETRDSILARLKARAQVQAQAPIAVPKPEPKPIPKPAPLPPPPPPPPPPAPKPVPKPEPFHSYTTDFADRIDKDKASTFSVLAAQSDAKPRTVAQSRQAYKKGVKPSVVLASALVLLGVGVISFSVLYFLTRPENIVVTQGVPSLIEADETTKLEGVTGTELLRALKDASEEPLVSGNVLVTYTTSASSTTKGIPIELPQPGGTLFKALPIQAPDILLRNIRLESTVGVINAGNETRPFFILKVSSFERTFAGMLAWEPAMRSSLALLFPAYVSAPIESIETTATSTATTSVLVASRRFAPTSFVDAVVRNYDVRILRDADGRSLMLYGYKDKETLIIARDEAAFLELVTRLNANGS